jgi:hypothetical protein
MHRRTREPEHWLYFNSTAEVRYCSRPLLRLLGRDASEVRGTPVTSILPELPLVRGGSMKNTAVMRDYVARRRPLQLTLGEGRQLVVDASVSADPLGAGDGFIVVLKADEATRWLPGRCEGRAARLSWY